MKNLLAAAICAALLILAAFQVVMFQRMTTLERKLREPPSGYETMDRRLASLKRAVERLGSTRAASDSRGSEVQEKPDQKVAPPPTALAAAAPGAPPEREKERQGKSDEEKEKEEGEEDEAEASEEDASSPPQSASPQIARRKELLEDIRKRIHELDSNGDAQLSLKELDDNLPDFLYFDSNASGHVTLKEIERTIAVEEEALNRVAARDADQDGRLSPAELNGSSRRFRALDVNGDGGVTTEELVLDHRRLSERLTQDDLDNDHKLSREEFSGSAAKFSKYDKDKDGFMSRSELKAMLLRGHD